ncbi:MAG TPA: hypothetical protein VHZ06_10445, partial [Marmoricola sp.]|nr:hypothetical protein [Marmoricola sp.]
MERTPPARFIVLGAALLLAAGCSGTSSAPGAGHSSSPSTRSAAPVTSPTLAAHVEATRAEADRVAAAVP